MIFEVENVRDLLILVHWYVYHFFCFCILKKVSENPQLPFYNAISLQSSPYSHGGTWSSVISYPSIFDSTARRYRHCVII